MENRIYLDYAASTPLSSDVYKSMLDCFTSTYGNASSIHYFGRVAAEKLEESRAIIAKAINAKASEVYFTSGGTEANNWAIFGLAHANKDKGNHIIVSAFEHHSVLECAKKLETEGFDVTYLPINKRGWLTIKSSLRRLEKKLFLFQSWQLTMR